MRRGNKELLVVGDRVLVRPEAAAGKTGVGLFLPPGVLEKRTCALAPSSRSALARR